MENDIITTGNLITQNADNFSYVFPRSEEIIIPRSELQIQLGKFKEKILSCFSMYDFLAIVSLWAPIFTADFKPIFTVEADAVCFGYIVFAMLVTLAISVSRTQYHYRENKDVSGDPEEMSYKILQRCQSKPKQDKRYIIKV